MKLSYYYYIPQTGESTVALVNRYGTYVGHAKVHPDDKENTSERAGLRLAEYRAWINALKSDRRRFKLQQRTILSLYKDILNNVDTPIEIQHRFDVFLNKYKKDIEDIDTNIKVIEKAIQEDIKLRDKILNRSKENKES